MACLTDKFVINKSLLNEYTLTIKQQDSTLPMVLTDLDVFEAHLFDLDTNAESSAVLTVTPLTPYDDGKIKLVITNVDALKSERGAKVDRYYLKPTYRLAIECTTTNNGNFVAKVDTVYVDA